MKLYHLLFLLIPALSIAQTDSANTYEQLNVMVPMRDGVRLATNIFRPDSTGTYPVLLLRTPYRRGEKGRHGEYFFVKNGYAVVVQDTRGRYDSEGIFDPFQNEANDGFDIQEWIGHQKWCNGKIGTFGSSYEGVTQWLPAPLQSKYLKAIFAAKTFSNFHNEVYHGGAFRILRFCAWSYEMSRPEMATPAYVNSIEDSLFHMLPLANQEKLLGWKISFLKDWMAHPQVDNYWNRSSVSDYTKVKAAVYNQAGWFDSFLKGTIENYVKMTGPSIDPQLRKRQRLMIGPWLHATETAKTGDLDFGETANVDTRELQLLWFNDQLQEKKNELSNELPVKIFVMGINKWRYEREWPLIRTRYTKYYLDSKGKANTVNGNGILATTIPAENHKDTFTYDPLQPVPNIGNLRPMDQRAVEQRNDVLVFTTSPLKSDLEVTGNISVTLYASSSAINTDFTAKLLDVYPDGKAINLREGIIRTGARKTDAPFTAIEPGKIYQLNIDLWATSNVFKAGHSIRVEISSSNFPMFDRNLNTAGIPAFSTTHSQAFQTIYHSKQYPSCIILPIINN